MSSEFQFHWSWMMLTIVLFFVGFGCGAKIFCYIDDRRQQNKVHNANISNSIQKESDHKGHTPQHPNQEQLQQEPAQKKAHETPAKDPEIEQTYDENQQNNHITAGTVGSDGVSVTKGDIVHNLMSDREMEEAVAGNV